LKFDELLGKAAPLILLMIYSHLAEKLSINKLKTWIEKTELPQILDIAEISNNGLYEALDYLEELDWDNISDSITRQWFSKYKQKKDTAIILDVTDTYFSGSQTNWKKRRGKDGKYDKLIQIALAVSSNYGFPLKHKTYEGNISNVKIMSDFISEVKFLGMKSLIIDRGMTSIENLTELQGLAIQCIAGLRSNKKLETQFLEPIVRNEIFSKQCQVSLKGTVVYVKNFDFLDGKIIVVFNPEIEVAQRNKLLKKETVKQNEIEKMKYFGYSFIYHTTDLEVAEVVQNYYDKDIVEKSFKTIKGVLSLHPLRVKILERVSAHVKICYLSFCILTLMNFKLKKIGISAVEAIDELSSGHKVILEDNTNNRKWSKIVTLKKIQEKILRALGCEIL
jgi:transposase